MAYMETLSAALEATARWLVTVTVSRAIMMVMSPYLRVATIYCAQPPVLHANGNFFSIG